MYDKISPFNFIYHIKHGRKQTSSHLPPDRKAEHKWKLVFRGFSIASIIIGAGFAIFILYVALGGSAGLEYPRFVDRLSTYDSYLFFIPDAGVVLGLFGLLSDRKRLAGIGIIVCVIMGGFIFVA